ncbi:prepilin-type N-terminal cleavage/methylation domain-containing protein [Sphingomonas canadensis]|uniref:Type II secretion system protein H n=1 Tax=Sphingomonas canadensis TaxID=1219257 RepID=A0ABW3H3A1_9SPHN|nr:GspH/FimT family pseudopilin [Sphingomonas canadensis]MCW3835744.1 prepilin-type N-terminal cleavage/methylation domain-containing protein [Sphingomonas canadensis]
MPGGRAIRRDEAGLTLVEMLVVLAIIGVISGAAVLGIGAATRAPTAEAEAHRLATQLQAAGDDAMLGDRLIAFTVAEDGYGFADVADGKLTQRTRGPLGFHRLPAGMVMTLDAKPPVMLGADGSGQPVTATIEAGGQTWRVAFDGITATASAVPAS